MKRCHSCATAKPWTGRIPDSAEKCPMCGGRAFFYGARMSRALWPPLPDGWGPERVYVDTWDPESDMEVPGEWDRQVSTYTEPRWRRKES